MVEKKVVILGAGPAGISAAYLLKKAGIDCLLVDKKGFPKDKCCGGMLTEKTVDLIYNLGFELDESIIKNVIKSVNMKYKNNLLMTFSINRPMYMTQRSELDYFFFKEYLKIGGEFKVITKITFGFAGNNLLRLDNDDYHYGYVIGATGARGFVYPGENSLKFLEGIALEGNTDVVEDNETVDLEILDEASGYAWRFPKTSHENIGYGLFLDKTCKEDHDALKTKYLNGLGQIRGAYLRVGNKNTLINSEYNLIRVGDCAGTVDAVTGEGIYYALKSGAYAAHAIISGGDDALRIYKQNMIPIMNRLNSSIKASKAFYKHKAFAMNFLMKHIKRFKNMMTFITDEVVSAARYDYHKKDIMFGYMETKGE